MGKIIKKIFSLPLKLLIWISHNTSETCLISLYIVSVIPLLTNSHGVKFYSFLGGYCTFASCLFLRWQYKDRGKDEPTRLFNILGVGMILLGMLGLLITGYYEGNDTIKNRFHIFLLTYFGGFLGFIFGCLVFLRNKYKDNRLVNKTNTFAPIPNIRKLDWIDINKEQPDKGKEVIALNEDGIFFIGEIIFRSYNSREGKYECVNGEDGINNVILWIYLEDLKLSLPNKVIEKIKEK
jgi:hypothetical protein